MTRAYHFLKADMRSGWGSEQPWRVGETRTMTGKVKLCDRGYHCSPTLFEALQYTPGPVACIVELADPITWDGDKGVSLGRTLVKAVNVEVELRLFAADCAEHVAHPYKRRTKWQPAQTIDVVRRFARGEATATELKAAAEAARAARAAAEAAGAARAAAGAAWAAWAAWAAAGAARAAEEKWQRERFDTLVLSKLEA